jgi:Flp pilus assembly protein TadB
VRALLAVLVGATTGLGVLLIATGITGIRVIPSTNRFRSSSDTATGTGLVWLTVGLVVGVVVYALTGWPVAAVACGIGTVFAPRLTGGRRDQERYIARTEAMAVWTELIRDNLAGGVGIEQALAITAQRSPRPIRAELARFQGRLDRNMPLVEALTLLGADLAHPSSDLVIVALVKASRLEVRDLGPLLTRLSESIRDDVRMRLRVEVSRARIRTSSRIVVGFTFLTVAFLVVFARELLTPYDELAGQLWMCVVLAVFVGAGWLIGHYGKLEMPTRFQLRPPTPAPAAGVAPSAVATGREVGR